jgi:hypothetical protein
LTDNFCGRTGQFPFFELPVEVRKRIFRFFLGPFYKYNKEHKTDYIDVQIHCSDAQLYDLAEERRASTASIGWAFEKTTQGSGDKRFAFWVCPMIEMLRQASYVSSQFRYELGVAFWERTSIRSPQHGPLHDYVHCLMELCKERPAIHRGIKCLQLHLQAHVILCVNTERMRYLATVLELDHLHLNVALDNRDIEDFARGVSYFPLFGEGLRKLKVSKSFTINFAVCTSVYTYDNEATKAEEEESWTRHFPAIRELLMPDTLRPKPAETGIDKYLVSRVQPREEPDSVAAIRFGNGISVRDCRRYR